ncbi:MAG: LysM peptidoglycan-binding domain-containing protein [Planctomycetota bacterium]|jgi:LysM repeat protein
MRRRIQIEIIAAIVILVVIGVFLSTRTNVNEPKLPPLVLPKGGTQHHEIQEIKWEEIPEKRLENSRIIEKPQIVEELQIADESGKIDESQLSEEIPYEEEEEILPEDEQQVASVGISTKTIHKVKPNDSLFKIAKEYFGDGTKWNKIFEANKDNMPDPHSLYVGQELLIPDVIRLNKPQKHSL